MKSSKPTNPGADSGQSYAMKAPSPSGTADDRRNERAPQTCPGAAPTVSPPDWSRYIDSRLKQFCSR